MRLSIIVDYADDHVGTVADHTKSGGFSRFINCRTEPAVVNLADDHANYDNVDDNDNDGKENDENNKSCQPAR